MPRQSHSLRLSFSHLDQNMITAREQEENDDDMVLEGEASLPLSPSLCDCLCLSSPLSLHFMALSRKKSQIIRLADPTVARSVSLLFLPASSATSFLSNLYSFASTFIPRQRGRQTATRTMEGLVTASTNVSSTLDEYSDNLSLIYRSLFSRTL
jgi:hypothetical protein